MAEEMSKNSRPSVNDAITIIAPDRRLQPFISHYEYVVIADNVHINNLILYPSFGAGFIFYFWRQSKITVSCAAKGLEKKELPDVLVMSPCDVPFVSSKMTNFAYFRVVFRPGKMYDLFHKKPMRAYRNATVDARDVLDKQLKCVYERMRTCERLCEKVTLVESFLLGKLPYANVSRSLFPILERASSLSADKPATVSEIARQTGLSRQQLTRLTNQQLGLTSKEVLRVLRFHNALRQLHHPDCLTLTQTALDLGYYDQAHFTTEFRRFSGETPGEYLRKIGRTEIYGEVSAFSESGMVGR